MNASSRLRQILADGKFVAVPGVYDPLTARIIESVGFLAVYLGGNAIGLRLGAGQPFITMTETVDSVRQVLGAITAPLIVDAGAGFGNPAHVRRACRELERAGAAAVQLDDQPYPKRASYHAGKGELAPLGEMVARIAAAKGARQDANMMIFARTDALRVTKSVDDVIRRCKAYVDAGADALMILDLMPDQMKEIRGRLPNAPVGWFVSPAMTPPSLDELERAGFKLAIYPFNTVAAVADSVMQLWQSVADTGRVDQPPAMVASLRNSLQQLIGMEAYWHIEQQAEIASAGTRENE